MEALSSPAELIFTNADASRWTTRGRRLKPSQSPRVEILVVGSAAEVEALKSGETRVVDLGGRALLPGFVDGHSHFFQVGARRGFGER